MQYSRKSHGRFQFDGYKKLFNIQTRRFPIGLLHRVVNICENQLGYKCDIKDNRIHLPQVYDYKYDEHLYKYRPDEFECIILDDERVIIRTKLEKPSKIKGLALI